MKRIKVNNDANTFGAFSLLAVGIAVLALCIWVIYTNGIDIDVIEGLVVSSFVIYLFVKFYSRKNKDEYVSDLLVSRTALTLIYKYKDKKRQVVISTKDIKYVKADFVDTKTTVDILKTDGEHITFKDYLGKSISLCYYTFLLDLISVSEYLPNFTYDVYTDNQSIKDSIEYFRVYGRRRTFVDKLKKELAKTSIFTKICLFIFACIFMFLLSIVVCPPLLDVLLK